MSQASVDAASMPDGDNVESPVSVIQPEHDSILPHTKTPRPPMLPLEFARIPLCRIGGESIQSGRDAITNCLRKRQKGLASLSAEDDLVPHASRLARDSALTCSQGMSS